MKSFEEILLEATEHVRKYNSEKLQKYFQDMLVYGAPKPPDIKIGDYYPEGDYLPEGDGNSLYDWIQARKCQCGSEATYGADCAASLHSDWCPKYSKES